MSLPFQRELEVLEGVQDLSVSNMQSATNDTQQDIRLLWLYSLSNQYIQPGSINRVHLETLGFQQSDQIFDSGSEVTSDRQFLQGDNQIPGEQR